MFYQCLNLQTELVSQLYKPTNQTQTSSPNPIKSSLSFLSCMYCQHLFNSITTCKLLDYPLAVFSSPTIILMLINCFRPRLEISISFTRCTSFNISSKNVVKYYSQVANPFFLLNFVKVILKETGSQGVIASIVSWVTSSSNAPPVLWDIKVR